MQLNKKTNVFQIENGEKIIHHNQYSQNRFNPHFYVKLSRHCSFLGILYKWQFLHISQQICNHDLVNSRIVATGLS